MTQEKLLNVLDELLDSCEYNYARPHENDALTQVYADRVEAMKIAINSVKVTLDNPSEFSRGWEAGKEYMAEEIANKFKKFLMDEGSDAE